jgi:hypothetical protein
MRLTQNIIQKNKTKMLLPSGIQSNFNNHEVL